MLTVETYVTILSAIETVRNDVQESMESQCRKVFFRNENEIRACVVVLAKLDRAVAELRSFGRSAS